MGQPLSNNVEVKVKTLVSFKPFTVPNFVNQLAPDKTVGTSIALREVGLDVLDELADRWLQDLYSSAGKQNGWKRPVWR